MAKQKLELIWIGKESLSPELAAILDFAMINPAIPILAFAIVLLLLLRAASWLWGFRPPSRREVGLGLMSITAFVGIFVPESVAQQPMLVVVALAVAGGFWGALLFQPLAGSVQLIEPLADESLASRRWPWSGRPTQAERLLHSLEPLLPKPCGGPNFRNHMLTTVARGPRFFRHFTWRSQWFIHCEYADGTGPLFSMTKTGAVERIDAEQLADFWGRLRQFAGLGRRPATHADSVLSTAPAERRKQFDDLCCAELRRRLRSDAVFLVYTVVLSIGYVAWLAFKFPNLNPSDLLFRVASLLTFAAAHLWAARLHGERI